MLQTYLPDDPAIQLAIKQDFVSFARTELKHRQAVGLPPFTRMVRIILRDQEADKLHKLSEQLAAAVNEAVAKFGIPQWKISRLLEKARHQLAKEVVAAMEARGFSEDDSRSCQRIIQAARCVGMFRGK